MLAWVPIIVLSIANRLTERCGDAPPILLDVFSMPLCKTEFMTVGSAGRKRIRLSRPEPPIYRAVLSDDNIHW
jgi:hypothetical protein